MKTAAITQAFVIFFILCAASEVYAADAESGWKTEIAPYAWLATVGGDFTTNGLPVHINESFGDVPNALDFGGMLAVESTKNRAAILFDTAYVKLSDTGFSMTGSVTELAGAYTAILPEGNGLALDVLAGLRFWYVENSIINSGVRQAGTHEWIDQFLGVRARWSLKKDLLLVARGDVGGFGVESKWSWNASGTVQCSISDRVSAAAGYRALYGHYESGDFSNKFKYSATLAGPVIGVTYRF